MTQLALFDPPGARAHWYALFERVDWVAPYDTAGGTPAGTVLPGVRCPGCGQVEPGDFLLFTNHGLNPQRPEPDMRMRCRKASLRQYHIRRAT